MKLKGKEFQNRASERWISGEKKRKTGVWFEVAGDRWHKSLLLGSAMAMTSSVSSTRKKKGTSFARAMKNNLFKLGDESSTLIAVFDTVEVVKCLITIGKTWNVFAYIICRQNSNLKKKNDFICLRWCFTRREIRSMRTVFNTRPVYCRVLK